MRKLYIYTGTLPNEDNGRHYMFADVSLYMAELQPHLLNVVDLDNYRINSNVAKIALKSGLNEENFDTVTYLIDYDDVSKYFRCYKVLRATLDTFVNYMLEVDLWATFIKDCDFSKVHVTRCNRKLNDYGIYDEPQSTAGELDYAPAEPALTQQAWLISYLGKLSMAKTSEVYIVFLMQFNATQQLFGSDAITTTKLFATPLSYFSATAQQSSKNTIDVAIDAIGGIYKIDGNDAQVLQAWLLPKPLLDLTSRGSSHYYTAKSKSPLYTGDVEAYFIYPNNSKKIDYPTAVPTDPNKIYYFGTINNGIKVKKYIGDTGVTVRSFIGATTLRVVIFQGEEQKDVTEDFSITLTSSASVTTSIRQFAKTMTNALSAGQSISKSLSKGDVTGAGLTGAGAVIGMINTTPVLNKAIGNGDAYTVFYIDNPPQDAVLNPFVVTSFDSVNDADKHVRMFGATFDYYASTGTATTVFDFEDKTLLGDTDILSDTYIVASCDIDGVPLEAHNEIGRKLTAGIYYKLLTE